MNRHLNRDMLPDPFQPLLYHVASKKEETSDSFTLNLEAANGNGFSYLPGQFNMLYAFGVGEVPISISGTDKDNSHLLHTIRTVGNVTQALSRLNPGDPIGLRGPFGIPWPLEECKGKNVLLLAGGIGLAPIRSLLYDLRQNRELYGQISVLYGARHPQDLLYSEELLQWIKADDFDLKVTVDFADPAWSGNIGVVTNLIHRVPFSLKDTIAMLCGPEIMMRFAIRELLFGQMPKENIYLSMERNMKCALGHCGRCQHVGNFICKDGPVLSYDKIEPFFTKKEI